MNRHNSSHQEPSLAQTDVSPSDPSITLKIITETAGRLLVLVPPDPDYGAATQRIWELAVATGRSVQLVSLCKDRAKEPSLRRQLVLMSALVGDSGVSTGAKVEMGTNWVDAVKRNYHTDDIIVCFADQREGFLHKPLDEILEENLEAPIFILSGLYPQRLNLLSLIVLWVGMISIITGAFFLQIQITSLLRDWPQTIVLIVSVIAEFSLIWIWNALFT
jgi:hypothetical protein